MARMFVWKKMMAPKQAQVWEEGTELPEGFHAVVTSAPGKARVLVEVYGEDPSALNELTKRFAGVVRTVPEQNWAARANDGMPPIQVRGRIVICNARTPKEVEEACARFRGRQVIAVPADMAFGTGHHATTATVLRMLVDIAVRLKGSRWSMADLGCGSGILAIAAAKLGAAKVWGCDFDAKAVAVAIENAERNGTPNLKFEIKDVLKWRPRTQYDVVIANIFFDILHAGFPQITAAVKPGGALMVSGILQTQAEECLGEGARCGVVWERVVRKGKWVSALGRVG